MAVPADQRHCDRLFNALAIVKTHPELARKVRTLRVDCQCLDPSVSWGDDAYNSSLLHKMTSETIRSWNRSDFTLRDAPILVADLLLHLPNLEHIAVIGLNSLVPLYEAVCGRMAKTSGSQWAIDPYIPPILLVEPPDEHSVAEIVLMSATLDFPLPCCNKGFDFAPDYDIAGVAMSSTSIECRRFHWFDERLKHVFERFRGLVDATLELTTDSVLAYRGGPGRHGLGRLLSIHADSLRHLTLVVPVHKDSPHWFGDDGIAKRHFVFGSLAALRVLEYLRVAAPLMVGFDVKKAAPDLHGLLPLSLVSLTWDCQSQARRWKQSWYRRQCTQPLLSLVRQRSTAESPLKKIKLNVLDQPTTGWITCKKARSDAQELLMLAVQARIDFHPPPAWKRY